MAARVAILKQKNAHVSFPGGMVTLIKRRVIPAKEGCGTQGLERSQIVSYQR